MNKKNCKYYPLILLMLALPFVLKGQERNSFPKAERLAVFTDRGLYISGENIHFAAFVTNHSQPGLSDIVYAEIIEPDGTRIDAGKFLLKHGASYGCLTIPSGILTGDYYFRVYTKYMRNLGPRSFAYIRLQIINPYKKEVLTGTEKALDNSQEVTGKSIANSITINTGKEVYQTRSEVNATINSNEIQAERIQRLCVSVVPAQAIPPRMTPMHSATAKVDTVHYFPENQGLSITGTLRDSLTKKGEAGASVNLSIIGKGKTFMATQTDSSGRFFFSLPSYYGNRDLFLGPQKIPGTHPKILVDNDFSVASVKLPNPVFKLDSADRKAAFLMAQNYGVRKLFNNDSMDCNQKDSVSSKAFYGKPSYTLKLDQYIQLPTLEDYLFNLPSKVKVRKEHGQKYLKIISDQPAMSFLKPLILVDWVAVDDPKKILAAAPVNISRIEVVNVPYVVGDMKYGGIVNIISKRGDFAGIDLPSSGMFLNYDFLYNNCQCAITTPESYNQPDSRNTLYWNPNVKMNSHKEVHFSFKTADTPGKYAIVIQGVGPNGKPFIKKKVIVVKPKP